MIATETAIRIAKELLENHTDKLQEVKIYIIPLANPDAAQLNLSSLNYGHIGAIRAVDSDRDGLQQGRTFRYLVTGVVTTDDNDE